MVHFNILTGRYLPEKHLKTYLCSESQKSFYLTKKTLEAFSDLRADLEKRKINLSLVSSFRSYTAQLNIWNSKASGARALLDTNERPIDYNTLTKEELLGTILRWSAIPGASRHHWGTEIDIYDASVKSLDQVSLTAREAASDFKQLYDYLEIVDIKKYGFFRPYSKDLGGVSVEPWHLSFKDESQVLFDHYDYKVFHKSLMNDNNIDLQNLISLNAQEIFQKYIKNISF